MTLPSASEAFKAAEQLVAAQGPTGAGGRTRNTAAGLVKEITDRPGWCCPAWAELGLDPEGDYQSKEVSNKNLERCMSILVSIVKNQLYREGSIDNKYSVGNCSLNLAECMDCTEKTLRWAVSYQMYTNHSFRWLLILSGFKELFCCSNFLQILKWK